MRQVESLGTVRHFFSRILLYPFIQCFGYATKYDVFLSLKNAIRLLMVVRFLYRNDSSGSGGFSGTSVAVRETKDVFVSCQHGKIACNRSLIIPFIMNFSNLIWISCQVNIQMNWIVSKPERPPNVFKSGFKIHESS